MITVEDRTSINTFGSVYWSVVLLIVLQGASGVITFCFVSAYKQLFIADGRNYFISNLAALSQILIATGKIVIIKLSANIVFLQSISFIISVVIAILYVYLFRKRYKQIDLRIQPDKQILSEKNAFLVHEISNAVFSSTDILLLSIFCDLQIASIYSIYNMVFSALNQLISQIHNGCFYILGQSYSRGRDEYLHIHYMYDTLYIAMVFTLMTVAYLLINPFVSLYTRGASNMNYVDRWLPLLFTLIQLLSCCRITASNLIKVSGHAQKTVYRSIAESLINLFASLILIQFLGIYGVLLGTVAALLFRTNDFIIYSNRVVLKRSPFSQYMMIGGYFSLFFVVMVIFGNLDLQLKDYSQFVVVGTVLTILMAILYFGFAVLFNYEVRKLVLKLFERIYELIKRRVV